MKRLVWNPSCVRARGPGSKLAASGGELGLHDAATAADGEGRQGFALNLLADEPLEVSWSSSNRSFPRPRCDRILQAATERSGAPTSSESPGMRLEHLVACGGAKGSPSPRPERARRNQCSGERV